MSDELTKADAPTVLQLQRVALESSLAILDLDAPQPARIGGDHLTHLCA